MDKKQIQDERTRGYFIDSAKNLIKGEGLRSISARHVADHAGYSYATLYNYFKDINDLIFRCVEDFSGEAENFIRSKAKDAAPGKNRIKATAKAYLEYFTEYPGVFELFFLEKMGNFGNKKETAGLITGLFPRLCVEDLNVWAREEGVKPEYAAEVVDRINSMMAGMLLFYENRMKPDNYHDFISTAVKRFDEML